MLFGDFMKKDASTIERLFENALWKFRYIIVIVVVALLVSSLLAFVLGIYSTYEAFHELSVGFSAGHVASNIIVVYLISSLDEFLLGIILIIIALGVYELFISKIDTLKGEEIPYPNWLTFYSLDDLKAVLTKVIIIILMVYFFKSAVVLHFDTPLSLLYLAIGIVLIAVANYLSHKQKSFDKGEKGH